MRDVSSEQKAAILRAYLASSKEGAVKLREASEALLEIEAELVAQGVPESLLLYMRAVHRERWALRRAMHDMARNSFPVEPLPDGALPVYDREPDVASLVTDDPEAGE